MKKFKSAFKDKQWQYMGFCYVVAALTELAVYLGLPRGSMVAPLIFITGFFVIGLLDKNNES